MRTTLKIAGLSAIFAAGLVGALDLSSASATVPTGKAFTERLPRRDAAPAAPAAPRPDALRELPADPCAKAVWPYVPRDCLAADGADRFAGRTITITPSDVPGAPASARASAPRVIR